MCINKQTNKHLLQVVFVELLSETQQIRTTPRHWLPTNNQMKLTAIVQILAGFIHCCLVVLRRAAFEMLVHSSCAVAETLGHFSFTKRAEHNVIRSLFKEFTHLTIEFGLFEIKSQFQHALERQAP